MTAQDKERFRTFILKRPWLYRDENSGLVTPADYCSLKARDGKFWKRISSSRAAYLLGFMDGRMENIGSN